MHIALEEAIALFESWRATATVLKVFAPSAGKSRELQGTVSSVKGPLIEITEGENKFEVNLADAEFNGDRRAAPNSKHGAYLVCEYRNGDRWSFYSPLPAKQEAVPNPDRRTGGYTPFPLNGKKPDER
jgi:hypothetical protein